MSTFRDVSDCANDGESSSDILDDVSVENGHRVEDALLLMEQRRAFDHFIANVNLTVHAFGLLPGHNSLCVVTLSYFLLYYCLSSKNRVRNRFDDHLTIHQKILFVINKCAAGNFGALFDLLYR